MDLGLKQGKTVIVVKDSPGFYTTRVLGTVIEESIKLVLEYRDVLKINGLTRKAGFPIGMLSVVDEIGVDVGIPVAEHMSKSFGERYSISSLPFSKDLVLNGFLGEKRRLG